jgi:acetyl esterase/lipase
MPLDRRAQRLLDMLAATRGQAQAAQTPQDRRAALEALAQMADAAPDAGVSFEDIAADGPDGPVALRLYSPQTAAAVLPALVFFHGGGWVAGGQATHDGLCRRLCDAAGVRVIAAGYRLAPEHRFPAGLNDCIAATRWVAANAARLGVDPARIAVGGDSVGGGLAAAVAAAARDGGGPAIALQLLICPILDVGRTGGSRQTLGDGYFISQAAFARDLADYLPAGVAPDDPRVSPLRAASFADLPPAIVHTAEFDPFRDEGEAYAEALRGAGVAASATRHPGMIHYFYAMARAIPYADAAAAQIGAQLRAALGPSLPFMGRDRPRSGQGGGV